MRELLRLAAFRRAHSEVSICRDGWGRWRAWIPDAPHSKSGTVLGPRAELRDLLDRLDELTDAPG